MDERLRFLEQLKAQERTANISRTTGEFLALLMDLVTPKRILEVGCSTGYSALWLSSCGAHVDTIEKREDRACVAAESFSGQNISLHIGDALTIIPSLKGPYDVLFLDATKREYLAYFLTAQEKLAEGALVIADNTISHAEKCVDFLAYVEQHYGAVTVSVGSGLTLFRFKSKRL